MRLSNFFTVLRLILAPLFFILYFLPVQFGLDRRFFLVVIIPLFVFMELTDFFDGYYARKRNQVSNFGKLFDPFADVLANLTVMFCFTLDGFLPSLLFLIILYRELSIMFLRMLARGEGITIAAKMGGKLKTVSYIVASGFSLFILILIAFFSLPESIVRYFIIVNYCLYGLASVLSVLSFLSYYNGYKKALKHQAEL
ncbi:CDP-diacylglycerol--glycerol-3-phosphate 3-phosphatidyltransferase [Treponema phagedenis]|uniref:CDP-diacylglycerol--glycerol-3-phosphate 3-phosphatidyltransferase n=1 Tax=Treponema phagedenis TaxID=162 RepID=A0A0B7GXG5_TREPH|nr:CDP-diacylglycerol--glycerol-3-phosphate 3-phosphatidyltransferase [Treponema phagedenis]QSI00700.1 CDP-diacylglycerol--glycerol-3-phosphate 3-phosphatidyltransferase [Treponema phagedenis]TYT78180.1 CDP-diacylglycerol--glycerol-3-phosphate 3-phosphatidyltransferase [Treponema phagedenis]CEM63208.1 CDP-diacylglycerol--glycerol-3-phosphate 3-phosphatidyltransferase [Treponema phagedenis]